MTIIANRQKSENKSVVSRARATRTVESGALLTPGELAERLAVPQTWVREKTRERARVRDKDPLPVVRLGKYVRFSWPAVEAWIQRQGT